MRLLFGEEFRVRRVRARIAAFDIVDAELVEQLGDGLLVLKREIDARRLLAVAERGVEEVDAGFGHEGILVRTVEYCVAWESRLPPSARSRASPPQGGRLGAALNLPPCGGGACAASGGGKSACHSIMIRMLIIASLYQRQPRPSVRLTRPAHILMHVRQRP